MISDALYGNFSSQAFNHQLSLSRTRFCRLFVDEDESLKILSFLSFHKVQIMIKKDAYHIFFEETGSSNIVPLVEHLFKG